MAKLIVSYEDEIGKEEKTWEETEITGLYGIFDCIVFTVETFLDLNNRLDSMERRKRE
jgi:hypothetical protein